MNRRIASALFAAAIGVVAVTISAAACQFSFNYSEIVAPLGTVGEIGVRVQKDHDNCSLPSMDDYQFAWDNIQVLGATAWEEVGPDLYERWFEVSLSELGDGYLMISKDCIKEGYEEAVLPITVLDPVEDGLWQQAISGIYPLDDVAAADSLETIAGAGVVSDGILSIDGQAIDLPDVPTSFDGALGEVYVFLARTPDAGAVPLLIASDQFFLRFDHLMIDGM